MPLPLYGSGSRSERISAAVCPTFCLSMPVMVMWPVLASTAMSMPSGIGEAHRMRVAELEDDFLPLDLGAVADADDVELALEAFGDAADVVRHQRAHQAVEGARVLLFIVRARELHDVVLDRHADAGDERRSSECLSAP